MDALKALPRWTRIAALSVIVLDEGTKVLARLLLPLCRSHGCPSVHLFGPVELVRIRNAGSAFGFLQGLWLWTAIAMVAVMSIPLLARRAADRLLLVGASLAAGAALGNLLDRLVTGGVTDFIYPGGPTVFNLADVVLAVGCLLMTWSLLLAQRSGHPALKPRLADWSRSPRWSRKRGDSLYGPRPSMHRLTRSCVTGALDSCSQHGYPEARERRGDRDEVLGGYSSARRGASAARGGEES